MPFYKALNSRTEQGRRTVEGLLRLRKALDESVPGKTLDETLLLATWNIREFGGKKSGGREEEPLYYIAEILSRFDLIALQEVRDDLDALDALMRVLGRWWDYLVSDVTFGPQGNGERLAYIYDSRKLAFGGLAGELVPGAQKTDGTLSAELAFARTPYLAGFRAGWFKFTICTDHFYYGEAKPDDPQRVREARAIVELLRDRMKSRDRWANNAILLGDFNVFSTSDETFKALERASFQIPSGIRGQYTNAKLDRPFDQIAFLAPDVSTQVDVARTGVFPFYRHVYREGDQETYLPGKPDAYREWRTYKMSDHFPVWVELNIDFAVPYLERKLQPPQP